MDYLDFLHGGDIYSVKRKYGREVIDFSANINPLGLPANVKKTIYANFDRILHYPDIEAKNITQKIAQYWGIREENILVGNGSVELIYLMMYAFKPKTTIIVVPTFSEYERAARCVKSRIQFIRLKEKDGYKLQDTNISRADILFLCNPNNPTGNLILPECPVINKLPDKLIVADEVFMDFLPDEEKHTLIWKGLEKSKRIVVLRTFTKFFALPGLRIGYLVAHKDIIKTLKKYQMPWSVNALALKAAECILADKSYINKTKQFIEKERSFLFNAIAEIGGLKPYPSVTNFLLIKIEDKNLSSTLLTKKLIQNGILIRDCANFRGMNNKFIRIAVRSRKENLRLIKALREVI